MLILTRYEGEQLRIDNHIIVKVVGRRGKQVKIGIEAPRYVQIHREEVYQRALLSGDVNDVNAVRDEHLATIANAAMDYADDDPGFANALNAAFAYFGGGT